MAERKALVLRSSDSQIEELPSGDTLAGASGGSGIPDGGTTGQILAKNSATDGDAGWVDAPSDGVDGTNGSDGADGEGVPAGGTTGQILAKVDGTDYNTEWVAATWKINRKTETASFTLTNADFAGGVYIECNHASVAIEVTIPASLTGVEPLVIERTGAATVTLIHAAVTLNSRDSLDAIANQHSSITIVPKGSDVYNAQGDLG